MDELPEPANCDAMMPSITPDQKIISWLFRITAQKNNKLSPFQEPKTITSPFEKNKKFLIERSQKPLDDWRTVASISGHTVTDLINSGISLPISAAEIDHFLRNHRETDRLVGRDFLSLKNDLPTPVAELYGLYKHRARLDTEATFFVAQATGSTRIARIMANLLAIGAFASGHECIAHSSMTYSVPAAFDTSDLIDRTCDEAMRRISLPIEMPSHLLKLSPDEISVLANNIVERYAMAANDFLDKANILAEARQDVHRMPIRRQFVTALFEGDLPQEKPWVQRLNLAYSAILPHWVLSADVPPAYGLNETDNCIT
ncbi:MAG: hypothetical protein PHD48_09535 [Alphaproteobacteria bacterium]|nr:hypothetical protein [Alphaproteobacteria bacterium]